MFNGRGQASSANPNHKLNSQKVNKNKVNNNTKNTKFKLGFDFNQNIFSNKNANKLRNSEEILFNNFFKSNKKLVNGRLNNFENNYKEKKKENDRYNLLNKPKNNVNKNRSIEGFNHLPRINIRNDNNNSFNKLSLLNQKRKQILPINNKDNLNFGKNNFMNNYKEKKKRNMNSSMDNFRLKKNINMKINSNQPKKPKNRPQSLIPGQTPKLFLISETSTIGLQNIGATCYMNATLQCLAHIQKLALYFLDSNTKMKITSNRNIYELSYAFLTVIENLWKNKNDKKYYEPYEFKEVISRMNPLFAGIQANDSKDLIIFLLEKIHQELNVSQNPSIEMQNNIDSANDQYNYEITFNKFSLLFRKNYNSVISNLFYGMFNSTMNCQNCKVLTYNVQIFNILIFPLQKVKEFKNKFINTVDLNECFEYYQNPEYLGGRSYYCNTCKQMVDVINTNKILYGPKVLIMNLNRGNGLEFDIKLNFDEYIDISKYVFYNNNEHSPTYYELVGIVTHFGPSSMSGHFIAFCKSFGNQTWYKYNDAMVSESTFEEAKNTGVPYVLFYSYIKR